MFKKFLTQYLIVCGVAANLAAVGTLAFAPGIAAKALNVVRKKADTTFNAVSPEQLAQDRKLGRDSLRRWRPDTSGTLEPRQALVNGEPARNLRTAAKKLKDGDRLEIGPGIYQTPMVIKANGVHIIGRGHVVLENAAAQGKGMFVVRGNNTTIENIECRKVSVPDRNGACVRLEGRNLTLQHVFFHQSQQGLLTGSKPGLVLIRDSFFENLGQAGQAHAIYQGGGELEIEGSYILSSKSEGHEVKSRASRTTISNSVIASLHGVDSRLIDASNGGALTLVDNTLVQGPNSSNWDMLGFALEKGRNEKNSLVMKRNLIILERRNGNRMIHVGDPATRIEISDNLIVSPEKTDYSAANLEYRSRKQASLPAYPLIPDRP